MWIEEKKCATHRSPDQTPNDYHLFPDLKKQLHDERFSTDDELKYSTKEWLEGQSELFYYTGIKNLWDRYKLYIDTGGDYIEKMHSHPSIFV